MNTLILSCNTGEGHNACARAIKEYYDTMNESCVIRDSLAFVSEEVSDLVAKGHVLIYRKFSAVFGWGYQYAENHPEQFDEDSRLYHFFARGAEDLSTFILLNHFDTVICTHPFSAMMLTECIKHYGITVKSAFVATDYTCCPGVNCSDLDLYFIPADNLADEFIEQGIPEEKILTSGIPVKQAFFEHCPKEKAKRWFDVAPNCRHAVIASGSMGCGPMEQLAESIWEHMDDHTEVTIVCGTNDTLQRSMEKMHRNHSRIHVRGFVDNMPLLLDSADVYVTKPGGLSTTESAAKHCPMVLVNAVGGCESHNLDQFIHTGLAKTGETVDDLIRVTLEQVCRLPQENNPEEPWPNGAKNIYDRMKEQHEIIYGNF